MRTVPIILTLVSGVSLYCGAAVAVSLFAQANPLFVAWLRVTTAAVLLLIAVRPSWASFSGAAGGAAALYGLATIGMNMSFYGAIAELPLGTAVAIEFFGPVVVAALGTRGWRDWGALLLAGSGVILLSGVQWSGSARGVAFALLSALLWALYIVLGYRVSLDKPVQGLTVGFVYGSLLTLPVALMMAPHQVAAGWPQFIGLAFVLGILSALIPYTLDMRSLALAGSSYFALLTALLPLVATVVGFVVLRQQLSAVEMLGIVMIVVAVFVRTRSSSSVPQRESR
ncbi:EamA family transporter [Corynebacterium hindlerae]|uniref:EamA family transporter n=1 Tax=Corynebacterium hindlerae TaxID=699041 RepID=UPI001AD7A178|nr:EamA family transporter [Corynebacterium hindlerae]QTH59070.1 EamA family transporter [Corynebacterium hindlerae]